MSQVLGEILGGCSDFLMTYICFYLFNIRFAGFLQLDIYDYERSLIMLYYITASGQFFALSILNSVLLFVSVVVLLGALGSRGMLSSLQMLDAEASLSLSAFSNR